MPQVLAANTADAGDGLDVAHDKGGEPCRGADRPFTAPLVGAEDALLAGGAEKRRSIG